ncbi:MAG: thioredoxin-like domain-containing protein [Bacteroidales bacterium]
MKKIFLFGAVALFFFSCKNNTKFKLSGTVENGKNEVVYLESVGLDATRLIDSVKLSSDGEFEFNAARPEFSPEFYQLRLKNQVISLSVDSTEFIEIKSNLKNFATDYTVSGSKDCSDIKRLSAASSRVKTAIDSLLVLRDKGLLADSLVQKSAKIKLADYKQEALKIIYTNPKSAAAYFALLQRIYTFYIFDPSSKTDIKAFGAVATAYDVFHHEHPRSKHLRDYTLQAMKAMKQPDELVVPADKVNSIGSMEIALPDVNGNVVRLTSLKGKVVVLNFTAYQSKFSPALNMLLGEIYSAKRAKGLEIYQVSLDDDENFWKVSASHLPWKCVRDITGSRSNVVNTYNVSELPTIFIINRTGEVVSRVNNIKNLEAEIEKQL